MKITISLAQIKKHSPCLSGWSKVLAANGGVNADLNKEFPVSSILDSNGLDDTLWVLRCLPGHDFLWRKFAWWCTAQVVDNTSDERVIRCLEVVKRYSECLATDGELMTALSAARSAAAELSAAAAAALSAAALSAEEAAALTGEEAAALSVLRRSALSAARLAALSVVEAAARLAVARSALSAARLAVLSAAEAAALEAAEAGTPLSAARLAALSAAEAAQEIKLRSILDTGICED